MVNDPIGDMFAQIKNASLARMPVVELPHSKLKKEVAAILVQESYLAGVAVMGTQPRQMLQLTLSYSGGKPAIRDIKRVSKPGQRWYTSCAKIPTVVGGMGIALLSTPQGIMTGKEARKRGLGGEVLGTVW